MNGSGHDEKGQDQEMTRVGAIAAATAIPTASMPLQTGPPKPVYVNVNNQAVPQKPNPQEPLSIDDAIERLGYGPFQHRILIAAGLCFAADSMEVLLLSFLAVVLQGQWNLTDAQTSTLTASVFLGAMVGTLVLGPLGDWVGRKPVFTVTALVITVFGVLTAAANTFAVLVFVRVMVGFGVGGLTVPFDTLAEFVPDSARGSNLLLIEYFWTLGTLLVPVFAIISLGEGDEGEDENAWRLFVILCSIPCFLSTVLGVLYVPESPRWLLTKNRPDEALAILRKAAKRNGHDAERLFPAGTKLRVDARDEESHNVMDLFSPTWLRTTLALWGTWAGLAFTYYGTIIVVTMVFGASQDEEEEAGVDDSIYHFDYGAIFTSALSEVAGTTLALVTLTRFGRIPTQVVSYLGGGISVLILCLLAQNEGSHRAGLVVTSFLSRMCFMAASCATWVSTAEILTTQVRTTGHAASNAIARISGAASPFLVTRGNSYTLIGGVLFGVSVLASVSSAFLPESMGKRMGAGASMSSSSSPNMEMGPTARKQEASLDDPAAAAASSTNRPSPTSEYGIL